MGIFGHSCESSFKNLIFTTTKFSPSSVGLDHLDPQSHRKGLISGAAAGGPGTGFFCVTRQSQEVRLISWKLDIMGIIHMLSSWNPESWNVSVRCTHPLQTPKIYIYPCRRQMPLRYLWHPKPKPFFSKSCRPCVFGAIVRCEKSVPTRFSRCCCHHWFPERAHKDPGSIRHVHTFRSFRIPCSALKKQTTYFFPIVETSLVLHVAFADEKRSRV